MFVCEKCYGETTTRLARSRGSCEMCGAVSDCLDVRPVPAMTPTREQLIEDIAGKLWRDLCEGEGQHSEALDKSLIRKHMDRLAACLAAPLPATPEPQAMPPIEVGDRVSFRKFCNVEIEDAALIPGIRTEEVTAIWRCVWRREPRP